MVAGEEDLNLVGTKILWLFTNLHLDFPLPGESVSSFLNLSVMVHSDYN